MTADFGAAAAAVLYGAGAVTLFGVRSWRHRRATGSTGFNGFVERGMAARVAGLCFVTAVLAGVASPLLARLHLLPLLWRAEDYTVGAATIWIGIAATAVGFGLAVVAQDAMGASWRIGVDESERTELVTDGVFAAARNPIFTAMMVAQLGTTLMAPTWPGLVGLVLLGVGLQVQVRAVEEPYLRRVHGAAYTGYAARTGRFVPGLGRLPAGDADARTTTSGAAAPERGRR